MRRDLINFLRLTTFSAKNSVKCWKIRSVEWGRLNGEDVALIFSTTEMETIESTLSKTMRCTVALFCFKRKMPSILPRFHFERLFSSQCTVLDFPKRATIKPLKIKMKGNVWGISMGSKTNHYHGHRTRRLMMRCKHIVACHIRTSYKLCQTPRRLNAIFPGGVAIKKLACINSIPWISFLRWWPTKFKRFDWIHNFLWNNNQKSPFDY